MSAVRVTARYFYLLQGSEYFMTQSYVIAPSILSADFARLGEEVDNVLTAGADWIHFDVMDNHYVPNLTVGPMVCKALKNYGVTAPIDVHLMVKPVERLVKEFAKVGAHYITFHPEACEHIDRQLQQIKIFGCKAGIALNPATSPECLKYVMDKLDLILIMSVNPGFGGQSFIPSAVDKIKQVSSMIQQSGCDIRLQVDGGVSQKNIKLLADAGADTFVAGSAIYGASNYEQVISAMRAALA